MVEPQLRKLPRVSSMLLLQTLALLAAGGFLAALPLGSLPASAHGGGLNAQGCHNQRSTGSYHCHRGDSTPAPRHRPATVYARPDRQLYPDCAAAIAAGVAPLRRGEKGYGVHLDRDEDGVACETEGAGASNVQTAPLKALPQPAAITLATIPATTDMPLPIEGSAQVLDGDTIQIGLIRIRLFGIDAFEAEQMCKSAVGETYGCGGKSTRALREKISGEAVTCMPKGRDAFERQLAVCRGGSTDLASWMARTGHALAYTKYAYDYVSDEAYAKANKAGSWDGSFEMPWDFRQTRTSGAAEAQRQSTAPSANCTIKGNVTR
jgi:endonuclease YncB( thermonuclease family)